VCVGQDLAATNCRVIHAVCRAGPRGAQDVCASGRAGRRSAWGGTALRLCDAAAREARLGRAGQFSDEKLQGRGGDALDRSCTREHVLHGRVWFLEHRPKT
jgi:hypothetical protein